MPVAARRAARKTGSALRPALPADGHGGPRSASAARRAMIRPMLIRDPVHGDLSLSPLEAAVLDLPEVQRLRGVKQLGTASLRLSGRRAHALRSFARRQRAVASHRRGAAPRRGRGRRRRRRAGRRRRRCCTTSRTCPSATRSRTSGGCSRATTRAPASARLLDGELGAGLDRLGIRAPIAGLLGAGRQPAAGVDGAT